VGVLSVVSCLFRNLRPFDEFQSIQYNVLPVVDTDEANEMYTLEKKTPCIEIRAVGEICISFSSFISHQKAKHPTTCYYI
jgi:hypothetical protein